MSPRIMLHLLLVLQLLTAVTDAVVIGLDVGTGFVKALSDHQFVHHSLLLCRWESDGTVKVST